MGSGAGEARLTSGLAHPCWGLSCGDLAGGHVSVAGVGRGVTLLTGAGPRHSGGCGGGRGRGGVGWAGDRGGTRAQDGFLGETPVCWRRPHGALPPPPLLEWAVAQRPREASCRSRLPVGQPVGVLEEDISLPVTVPESVPLVCLSTGETASEQVQGTLSPHEVKAEEVKVRVTFSRHLLPCPQTGCRGSCSRCRDAPVLREPSWPRTSVRCRSTGPVSISSAQAGDTGACPRSAEARTRVPAATPLGQPRGAAADLDARPVMDGRTDVSVRTVRYCSFVRRKEAPIDAGHE